MHTGLCKYAKIPRALGRENNSAGTSHPLAAKVNVGLELEGSPRNLIAQAGPPVPTMMDSVVKTETLNCKRYTWILKSTQTLRDEELIGVSRWAALLWKFL